MVFSHIELHSEIVDREQYQQTTRIRKMGAENCGKIKKKKKIVEIGKIRKIFAETIGCKLGKTREIKEIRLRKLKIEKN